MGFRWESNMFTKSFQLGRTQMSSCLPNTRQQLKCPCSHINLPAVVCFWAPSCLKFESLTSSTQLKGPQEFLFTFGCSAPPHLGLSVLGLYLLIPAALTPPNVAHCPLSPSIYYVLLSSAPVLLSLVALYYQFQLSQQRQTLTFDSLACLFTICTWALHLCTLQSVKYPYWRGKDK